MNTSDHLDQAPLRAPAFLLTLVPLAGPSSSPPTENLQYFLFCILSGTPPECQDCKEEINCSGDKGVQASSGEAGAGGGGGGGEGEGGVGEGAGGSELCAYGCKARGGCTVRYTGPPRGGPSIGDFISTITKIVTKITIYDYNQGSCFPAAFGGSCSGTPPECRDCNKARSGSQARLESPGIPESGSGNLTIVINIIVVTMYTRSCKEDSPAKPTTRPTQQQSSRRPITSSGEQTGGGPPLPQKVSHHILLELSPNTRYIYDDDTGNDDDVIGIEYDWSGWRKARRALSVFLCTRGKL